MMRTELLEKFATVAGVLMLIGGLGLGLYAAVSLPTLPGVAEHRAAARAAEESAASARLVESPLSAPFDSPPIPAVGAAQLPERAATDASAGTVPVKVVVDAGLPDTLLDALTGEVGAVVLGEEAAADTVRLTWEAAGGEAIYHQVFAAATRFDTVELSLRMLHIQRAWRGETRAFPAVVVYADTLPALEQLLGPPGPLVQSVQDGDELLAAVYAQRGVLALVPFERLSPRLAVYSVDGQTPVENAMKFHAAAYPLVVTVYAHAGEAVSADALSRLDALLPRSNRDPARLTVVAMTGVTAMVRLTADQMDRLGYDWPARVVGPELAAADITVISNEVPFVEGCETNTSADNLVFCSKPEYFETLLRSGVDIVGLTGNHQNDYGLKNALASLEFYAAAGIPVYGGGVDKTAAFAPLILEHNGNRLAFLGANSYGPPSAWATDFSPGSAPFDLAIMSATIRNLKANELADVVFAELQYQESYGVEPLFEQRQDFGALARAGADVVTGVQSHVPQAVEFVDGRLVLHGLGNLYFDQMWREDTREGMIAKHTIYAGRHISTQLLPTLLHDYGQPRWPDPDRRAAILQKVFAAGRWD